MKIVASTGGKGGVGKTTFALLLSLSLKKKGNKVVLCDCDVECPNLHVLLNVKLKDGKNVYFELPKLEKSKCRKCGLCSSYCKENAIFWVKGKHPFFVEELCSGCGVCWNVCPYGAIKKVRKIVGKIYKEKIDENLWLISGMCKPGISETGPIVKETVNSAIEFSNNIGADFLIIDTAPGLHCNVIQALVKAEKIYIVTEPTPLGAHDLELMLELSEKLGIESEIVLNKFGVGNQKMIEEVAMAHKKTIAIKIPYSEELVKAYCEKEMEKMVKLI